MRAATWQLARVVTWSLAPVFAVVGVTLDGQVDATGVPVLVAMAACWSVGVVITWRVPEQRAGWGFLGLGTSLAWSAACDSYAQRGPDLPGHALVATLGDTSWIWWFVFLALVLQYTAVLTRRDRFTAVLPVATVATGALFQVSALLRSTHLDPPWEELSSPWAVPALDVPARFLAAVAVYGLGLCLVGSVVILVRASRRATGEARQQLLWLVAGAVPVAPAVVGAFVASWADRNDLATVILSAAVISLVTGAALSVLRYRLYDVERVVTESAAYAIAASAVMIAYIVVVVVVSRSTPVETGSKLPTIAATLAGVGAARVAYVWGLRAVGRRVNPVRFDVVDTVRAGLAESSPDLDALVASALGPHARVMYLEPGGAWVAADGKPVAVGGHGVGVRRHGALIARLEFDPAETDPDLVDAVAAEAAAEIDNVALRAEVARQLDLVRESRARLATAQLEERRRIERDLHDGAQQRLLAIALLLQSARLNGDLGVLRAEVDRAVADLRSAVQELRGLAAGLQPPALASGGLVAALAELAAWSPLTVRYDVTDGRFSPDLESAAWFVIAEAVTNAVKHSGAGEVCVQVRRHESRVCVEVSDSGVGGADAGGHGLLGLADRVDALGGTMEVADLSPHGTRVEAVFPCGS